MRFHHSRGGQKAAVGVRLGEEELVRSKLALRSILPPSVAPAHTRTHGLAQLSLQGLYIDLLSFPDTYRLVSVFNRHP